MAKTLREYYGEALVRYGKENEKIIVLDADVSGSTRSALFRDAFPDRHLNVGIAEANMTGMAAGLASVGMIPFVNTFAAFVTSCGLLAARTFGSYSKLPIKLVGTYSGMSDAFDGPSHHALDDIAIMRAQPNFEVIVPVTPPPPTGRSVTVWKRKNPSISGCPAMSSRTFILWMNLLKSEKEKS